MKKTLIALAVLSASAAAFASVSITGNVEAGYIASNNVNGKAGDRAGFGINKSNININSTEDLGNGIKVAAQLGIQGADRSGANDQNRTSNGGVTGGESFLNIISPVGTVGISSTTGVDYLSDPTSISGVAGYSFAGNDAAYFMYGVVTPNTAVNYTADVGPVQISLAHVQAKAGPIGTGITGADMGQRDNEAGITYKIGGFAANVGYKSYDSSAVQTNFAAPLIRQVMRAQAAYDFGVAKIGGGVSSTNYVDGRPNTTTWLLGAAAPVGPLTLGAQVTQINSVSQNATVPTNGASYANLPTADQIGVAYTAKYDLSKQTSLKAAYARWQQTNTTGYNTSEVSVLLAHSF